MSPFDVKSFLHFPVVGAGAVGVGSCAAMSPGHSDRPAERDLRLMRWTTATPAAMVVPIRDGDSP